MEDKLRRVAFLLEYFKTHHRYQNLSLEKMSIEMFKNLPIIRKQDLIDDEHQWRRKHVCYVSRTSGTTKPLLVTHSKKAYEAFVLRVKNVFEYGKVSSCDVVMNLFPSYIDTPGRYIEDAFKNHVGAGVIPMGYLMNDMLKKEAISLISRLSPTVVVAYTNQIEDFFRMLIGAQHDIKKCFMGGEPLTKAFQQQLKDHYDVDVYNVYGTTEFGFIGIGQSNQTGYLELIDENLWIEVLQDDGTVSEVGEGDIVITDLENISMPFIRYRLGDRVRIIKDGDKKRVMILGRSGGTFLYGTEIYAQHMVEEVTKRYLENHPFFYLIQKDAQTYKDMLTLYTDIKNGDELKEIKKKINQELDFGKLFFVRSFEGSWPKTSTGKRRYIIDARENG